MPSAASPRCCIIIPVLNDGQALIDLLDKLQPVRQSGCRITVVDGGSNDLLESRLNPLVDRYLQAPAGRAGQMNAGANDEPADILWFLHADTRLDAMACLSEVIALPQSGRHWGRFNVRLDANDWRLRLVESLMNLRSRLTGIATGDQGLFIMRDAFMQVGGYPDLPLMEDIVISRRLKRLSRPQVAKPVLTTSARRWQRYGVFRTIVLMWSLRLAFYLGVPASRLARYYRSCSSPLAS